MSKEQQVNCAISSLVYVRHRGRLTPLGSRPQPWAPENQAKRLALHKGIRTAKSSKPSGLRAMAEAIDLRFVRRSRTPEIR